MLDEELKDKSNLKKLEKQANNLKIMIMIQFICLIFIAVSIINIIANYTTSSINTLNVILSVSGLFAILIFFLISNLINTKKVKFKTNYYDIVMLPIIKKVNFNWIYLDENNISEIVRELILSGFYKLNGDRVSNEKTIKGTINMHNILIYQINLINIIGYGKHRKIKKLFNGIFAVVETNIDKNFNLCIERNNGFVKIDRTLNNIKIRDLIETFGKNTSLDFDLVIRNSKIYFRIFSGDRFKEHIFKKLVDKNTLESYYFTLKFMQEISNEILKIN